MRRGLNDECRVENTEKKLKTKITGLTLCAMLFALCSSAHAQQQKKIPRIGFLAATASGSTDRVEGLRQGLRELGYVEGKNIVIEYRYAEGKLDRLSVLAAELVRLTPVLPL